MKIKIPFLFLSAFVLLISSSACNNLDCVNGSGKQVSQIRTVEPFTKIETGGAMKIVLKQDSVQQVRVVADDNIQERIKTEVHGDVLGFEMDGNFCSSGPITLYISAKNINGVSASGSVELLSDGKINTKDFLLDLSGNSHVDLTLNAGNVITKASGSSEIRLKGQAGSHEVDLSGSGKVEAVDFVVGNYRINTSGSSQLRINVLNDLQVNSSGSSDIAYRGNPKRINNDKSGSSSLKRIQ